MWGLIRQVLKNQKRISAEFPQLDFKHQEESKEFFKKQMNPSRFLANASTVKGIQRYQLHCLILISRYSDVPKMD